MPSDRKMSESGAEKRPKPKQDTREHQPRAGKGGKTAVITGVTGQDGSYLAELLLAKGYEVIGVVRRTSHDSYERIGHLLDRVHVVAADLLGKSHRHVRTRPDRGTAGRARDVDRAGAVPHEPGVPGGGGGSAGPSQQVGAPRLPGQLGDLQRRFGL